MVMDWGVVTMARMHLSMQDLMELNADEVFYKEMYLARKSPETFERFLAHVDKEDAVRRHLVIPDLLPEIISYYMPDSEYFKDDERNVYISRHNRYTPSFLHRHDFFEIIYVYSGSCTQNIDLEQKRFKPGDLIFIAPNFYHTMEVFDDDSIVFNILLRKETFYSMFHPLMRGHEIISEFFSEGLYNSQQIRYLIFHPGDDHLQISQQNIMQMYEEQVDHDEYSDQILIGLLTYFIANTMREFKDTMESSLVDHKRRGQDDFKVMSYIQENIATVTLNQVADHFGFSTAYCSRLIKSNTGQSFNDWKRIIRIRQAETMLRNTDRSIMDIGADLGYENPETFIRAFKKELHTSPSRYRKDCKSSQT